MLASGKSPGEVGKALNVERARLDAESAARHRRDEGDFGAVDLVHRNAAQLLEKYKSMARDAQLGGDRVQLTDREFRVLEYLMRHASEVIARADPADRGRAGAGFWTDVAIVGVTLSFAFAAHLLERAGPALADRRDHGARRRRRPRRPARG